MTYQLHWDDKQLRLNKKDRKKLLDHQRFVAFKKMLLKIFMTQEHNRAMIAKFTKLSEVMDFIEKQRRVNPFIEQQVLRCDPLILNDFNEGDWQYSQVRIKYLETLKGYDEELNMINMIKKNEHEQRMIQQGYNMDSKKERKGIGSKIVGGIKRIFNKNTRESKVNFQYINDINNINMEDDYLNQGIDDLLIQQDNEGFNDRNKRAELYKDYNDNLITSPKLEYDEMILQNRSFFSLKQLMKAKMVSQAENISDLHEKSEKFDLNPRIELDLMSSNANGQQSNAIDDLLNFKQPYKGEKSENKSNIHVFFASNLGTYEVTKVHTMHPKALRNGVETILKICKNYKTIQQIDLAAFSQDKHNEDYFWNLVFWFKYQSLPYLWMAPFLSHLSPTEQGSPTRSTMQTEM